MLQDLFSRRAPKSAMPLLRRTRSRLHISLHEAAEDDPAGLCNPVQAESQDYGASARGSSVALVLSRWRGSVTCPALRKGSCRADGFLAVRGEHDGDFRGSTVIQGRDQQSVDILLAAVPQQQRAGNR